jgi:hypothetical protein
MTRNASISVKKILFLLPIVIGVLWAFIDYNGMLHVPFWSLWSLCYLLPESNLSVCSMKSLDSWADWVATNWNWDLEPMKRGQFYDIAEFSGSEFSYEKLAKESAQFTRPVVFRGRFNNTAAVKKWSADYFEEMYGEEILITLLEGRPDKQYEISTHSTTATDNGYGYQKIMQPVKMKLKNAIKRMREGKKLYISNIDTIFRKQHGLIEDLQFPDTITPWAYNPYMPYAAQMFFGIGSKDQSDTTGTLYHCAASANLFVQVKGDKHWTFIPARYGVFLHPSLGRVTPAAKTGRKPGVNVPAMRVTLHPGDVLFNPPWLWHEIHNDEGWNIGVATRENHPAWTLRNNWLFSFLLEFRATPRVAKNMIPEEQKAMRFVASIPFLTLTIGYVKELFTGPTPHPIFTAAYNPCDEHDPNGCTSTILDRSVYSDDINHIPYHE